MVTLLNYSYNTAVSYFLALTSYESQHSQPPSLIPPRTQNIVHTPLHLKLNTACTLDWLNSWVCQQVHRRLKVLERGGNEEMCQWNWAQCSSKYHLCRCPMWGKPGVREHWFTDRVYSSTVIDSTQLCLVTHLSTDSLSAMKTQLEFSFQINPNTCYN